MINLNDRITMVIQQSFDLNGYFCYIDNIFFQPVHIACIGEGPVVHVMPLELDWGTIPVLQAKPKKILLSNESLIPAKFTANMVKFKFVLVVKHTYPV
jgi:hydrocephalus-inducing protein